ncbi:uncharacterized protein LOC9646981 [Selaginella moellendorffii]|nr:uncharacterized protein LOC9646981 [Selaginella moellendorffii]|eukprot:XP_002981185.2 uncharacterized protein LOC9646981 [Selaginella moellendorffii]
MAAAVLWGCRRQAAAAGAAMAARLLLVRHSGSVTFRVDAEAASHMASVAAADAKDRGLIAGAGVDAPGQRIFKSKQLYRERVVPALVDEFGYSSIGKVPIIEKIVVYCNFRLDRTDAVVLETTVRDMYILTGQRPTITKASKPVSGSAYRVGDPVGCKVTLRGELMYPFMDRLLELVVPKTRGPQKSAFYAFHKDRYDLGTKDFSSLSANRFEHIHQNRGLKIALVTGAESRLEAKRLLMLMGLPYLGQTKRAKPKQVKGRKGVRMVAGAGAGKKAAAGKKGKGGAKQPAKKKK